MQRIRNSCGKVNWYRYRTLGSAELGNMMWCWGWIVHGPAPFKASALCSVPGLWPWKLMLSYKTQHASKHEPTILDICFGRIKIETQLFIIAIFVIVLLESTQFSLVVRMVKRMVTPPDHGPCYSAIKQWTIDQDKHLIALRENTHVLTIVPQNLPVSSSWTVCQMKYILKFQFLERDA